MYALQFKRIIDIVIASFVLVVFSPILLLLGVLISIKLGAPVIFSQQRAGLNGEIFTIYKFRSMTDGRDKQGNLLPDKDRLPAFGKFLRSTSLDELPELWNVLRGDMSLVGPRPLYAHYLDRYTPEQQKRHDVKPGITGWAQVRGRNAISWEARFKLDVWYVNNVSFLLDMKILFLTIWKTVARADINQPGQATMQEFTGHVN